MRLSQVQGYLVFPNRLTERGGGDIIGVKKERIPDPLFDEISPFGRNDRLAVIPNECEESQQTMGRKVAFLRLKIGDENTL